MELVEMSRFIVFVRYRNSLFEFMFNLFYCVNVTEFCFPL